MFRRSSAGATGGTAQDSRDAQGPGATANEKAKERPTAEAKKGRPTPKRSEAERNRYQPITGTRSGSGRGGTSRASGPRTAEDKASARRERARRMDAMKRGEEWALGPRDRGPARKLARDYVDAHRHPMEYYMYFLVVLFAGLVTRSPLFKAVTTYLVMLLVAVIVINGLIIRRGLRKLTAERMPAESTRGLTMYAVMRAMQIRRWRMPAPRLKPGDKF